MYSKSQVARASKIITRLAEREGVPEAEVRKQLDEAMCASMNSSDPLVRKRWESFDYQGETPTVEEFLLWCAELTKGIM